MNEICCLGDAEQVDFVILQVLMNVSYMTNMKLSSQARVVLVMLESQEGKEILNYSLFKLSSLKENLKVCESLYIHITL